VWELQIRFTRFAKQLKQILRCAQDDGGCLWLDLCDVGDPLRQAMEADTRAARDDSFLHAPKYLFQR
jgi:hypothetical protein